MAENVAPTENMQNTGDLGKMHANKPLQTVARDLGGALDTANASGAGASAGVDESVGAGIGSGINAGVSAGVGAGLDAQATGVKPDWSKLLATLNASWHQECLSPLNIGLRTRDKEPFIYFPCWSASTVSVPVADQGKVGGGKVLWMDYAGNIFDEKPGKEQHLSFMLDRSESSKNEPAPAPVLKASEYTKQIGEVMRSIQDQKWGLTVDVIRGDAQLRTSQYTTKMPSSSTSVPTGSTSAPLSQFSFSYSSSVPSASNTLAGTLGPNEWLISNKDWDTALVGTEGGTITAKGSEYGCSLPSATSSSMFKFDEENVSWLKKSTDMVFNLRDDQKKAVAARRTLTLTKPPEPCPEGTYLGLIHSKVTVVTTAETEE